LAQAGFPEQLPLPPTLPDPDKSGYASVDGLKIWYASWGAGPPVLLLEGGEDSTADWGFLVPDLVKHGYRAVAIDRRCQGRSTCSSRQIDYHLFAEDDLAVMNQLGIKTAAIVGFSDGAVVGIDLALNHLDRVQRLFALGADSSVAGEIFTPSSDPTDMMAQTIPGAAELIIPDADHYAMWEQPALFSQSVLAFLSGN